MIEDKRLRLEALSQAVALNVTRAMQSPGRFTAVPAEQVVEDAKVFERFIRGKP